MQILLQNFNNEVFMRIPTKGNTYLNSESPAQEIRTKSLPTVTKNPFIKLQDGSEMQGLLS